MDRPQLRKIVIAGGSGFVGSTVANHLALNFDVVILSRKDATASGRVRTVRWNASDMGEWSKELEGAFALINLTGKNVNCCYTRRNRKEILESRTLSTRVLGEAVKILKNPPKVWLQMSSATIYRHSEDKPMEETFGEIGDDFSMNVCKEWESTFNQLNLGNVRRIIMRTSIVLGTKGGALPQLRNLVKYGIGGQQGSGRQMVSWIHENDFVGIVDWMLFGQAEGIYNVTAPQPLPNRTFMRTIRVAFGAHLGLRTPTWLLSLGAKLMGTETELVLKSRWVIPKKLLQEGYRFKFPTIESAMRDISA